MTNRMLVTLLVLGLFAWTVFVVAVTLTLTLMPSPSCPTEDSCAVDYRNGAWHIGTP